MNKIIGNINKNGDKTMKINTHLNNMNIYKNDTEIKYINNDKEEITESNEKDIENYDEKENVININDDFDKYFKIVDYLNNEEEEYCKELYKNKNILKNDFNSNVDIEANIFDEEISRISIHPKEIRKTKSIKNQNKKQKQNKIEPIIKSEISKEIEKDKNEIENQIIIGKLKCINSIIKNKEIYRKNNEFNNLLYNKTFKKFLKDKAKYYLDDDDNPFQFINSLKISKEKNFTNLSNNKENIINYEKFYNNSNNNNIIKKNNNQENNSREKNINFIYNTNYEKLENDNLRKEKEIKQLR